MQIRRSSCFICNFQGRRVSKTVRRALRLLLLFDADDKRELSVTEAAREMSIDKSVASRLLSTLASEGFLQRNLGTQSENTKYCSPLPSTRELSAARQPLTPGYRLASRRTDR